MNFKYKTLMDPVHGSIGFSEMEYKIISSPLFQRLHRVKQLGLVHLVYPGAVHTRFSHSIGVMHTASQMFDAILPPISEEITNLKQLTRLAALLHDIGHGSYSHTLEAVFRDRNFTIGSLPGHLKSKLTSFGLQTDLKHEHLSYAYIHLLAGTYLPASGIYDPRNVVALLSKGESGNDDLQKVLKAARSQVTDDKEKTKHDSLLSCIRTLLSSEIDADRIDYLMRDSLFCGTNIAAIDFSHILNSVSLGQRENEFFIKVRPNCISALEQVLISRKFMYDRVYNHKLAAAHCKRRFENTPKSPVLRYPVHQESPA